MDEGGDCCATLERLPDELLHLVLACVADAADDTEAADLAPAEPETAAFALSAIACTCKRMRGAVDQMGAAPWDALLKLCYPHLEEGGDAARGVLLHSSCMWRRYCNRDIETPSVEQMLKAVSRAATAHSFYKHLSLERKWWFSFGLSATAGMRYAGGKWIDYVRGDGTEFHYTWTPTADYRKNFGMLTYTDERPADTTGRWQTMKLSHTGSDGSALWQPGYVCAAAATRCSAAVHGESRHGFYTLAYSTLEEHGRAAIEGQRVQGTLSTATLQRRHAGHEIQLPPEVIDGLEALHSHLPAIREAASRTTPEPEAALAAGATYAARHEAAGVLARVRGLRAALADETLASTSDSSPVTLLAASLRDLSALLYPQLKRAARAAATEGLAERLLTVRSLGLPPGGGGGGRDINGAQTLRALAQHARGYPSAQGQCGEAGDVTQSGAQAQDAAGRACLELIDSDTDAVVEDAQRVRERYAMLEAVGRLCCHVKPREAAVIKAGLERVHDDEALFSELTVGTF